MHYLWQHIRSLLGAYKGELPLHHFLRQYYRAHPVLGSRDRRGISDAVYAWYRCGHAFDADAHSFEEKILAALFLCGLMPKALLRQFPAPWQEQLGSGFPGRLSFLRAAGYTPDPERIFPFGIPCSDGIARDEWMRSLLQQPDLFLRIRRQKERILQLLEKEQLPVRIVSDTCLALPNGAAVDRLLPEDCYVVQDASSQATGAYFGPSAGQKWWDCCSGAGGKSLLLRDLCPEVALLSSDIRESILHNLRQRFLGYRLALPETKVIDAADAAAIESALGGRHFDAVLCDVPCTGSGTWGRTPEGAYFFDPSTLAAYSARGEAILRNAAARIKPGGKIIYMTCSVFREENEDVIEQVAGGENLHIHTSRLINGVAGRADSLFVAVLLKGA